MAHPMIEKALKGLEAVRMTCDLRGVRGSRYVFPDDAASRLYYALYHACWAFLQSKNVPFDGNPDYEGKSDYYAHKRLAENLRGYPAFEGVVGRDWRKLLASAQRARVRADYRLEPVESREIERIDEGVERAIKTLAGLPV